MEITKSKLKIDRVDVVHHISDVHIRNYKRHAEYNRVFETLYAQLKKNVDKNHLILLTGDIVHSKTDVTPELFNEVQKFLNSLCDIAPVVMIPGNHDANLNNSSRLDALTPIVNALDNKRLEYVKESCILRLKNVDFYHWSVFDDASKYREPFEDSQVKIALYHGSVNNCTTEAGFLIENEKMKVESFKGFDFAMLGDIHRTQFLNPQKTIAYPGSLIQQNHGEGMVHGYLMWDIDGRHAEFVEIKNDTAFYTVEVTDGLRAPILESLPDNLYLRVRYSNTDQSVLDSIVEDIKKEKNVVELATQRTNALSTSKKFIESSRGLDFRSVEQQKELISKFMKNRHNANEEDINRVLEINEQINKDLKKNEVPRHSMWIPKRFEFDDMFSYGRGNHVDFTDMQGVYGMFAPNASGKSTLLDSLTFCLFDKCSKTNRGQQVMNANSDKFRCKLDFELNGLTYSIERKAKKQTSGNVRIDVDFYYLDEEGEKVSLNGKDRSETNANIRNLLGTYEDFVLTTLSIQSNHTGFIDMNQKDRKDLLSQFMDIGVFEELHTIAADSCRETQAVLKHYEKTDYETKLTEAQSSIEDIKKNLQDQNKHRNELEDRRLELNEKLIELATNLQTVDDSILNEELLETRLLHAKQLKGIAESEKNPLKDQIHSISIEIDELDFLVENIDEKELETKVEACIEIKEALRKLDLEYQKLESHINHKQEKAGRLNELEYDPDCKYCMNNVFVKDAISVKKELADDNNNLHELKKKKDRLESELAACGNVDSTKQSYDQNQRELSKKRKEITELTSKLTKIEDRISECEKIIKDSEEKLSLREKQLSAIEANKHINYKISSVKLELQTVEASLKMSTSVVSDLNASLKLLEKEIEDNNKQIEKKRELENSHKYYQYYLEAMHRDGIPHDIISMTIPQIEEEVNNILSQLVDFKIVFETDDKNVNAYIAYSEEKFWPLEMTSGMEKFVSSLAIRTSLVNISTLPRPNFLAVDEGFGTLDKGNLGSMSILFEYLKTQFKFLMVISHIDSMRDLVDDHIEIHKVDGKSYVKFG
jgi:DNA repair exonuclease SbcCD ATPase subunit